MALDAEEILIAALKLNDKEKAAIAASLLDSLDPLVDDNVDCAWQAEIQKRLREVETGAVSLVPWAEVRKTIDLDE